MYNLVYLITSMAILANLGCSNVKPSVSTDSNLPAIQTQTPIYVTEKQTSIKISACADKHMLNFRYTYNIDSTTPSGTGSSISPQSNTANICPAGYSPVRFEIPTTTWGTHNILILEGDNTIVASEKVNIEIRLTKDLNLSSPIKTGQLIHSQTFSIQGNISGLHVLGTELATTTSRNISVRHQITGIE